MFELVRKVVCDLNDDVIAEIESLDYHYFVFVVEQDEEFIMRTVVILNDYLLLRIVLRPKEGKFESSTKMRLKVA